MKRRRVVLDASVLYTEPVRGLLLWAAALGGFDRHRPDLLDRLGLIAEQR